MILNMWPTWLVLCYYLPLIVSQSGLKPPKGIKRSAETSALIRKYNIHIRDCPGIANSSTADRILKSSTVSNSKAVVIARISSEIITDCLTAPFNFSQLTRHFIGLPQKFSQNGRCRIEHKDEPYETFSCSCSYGYHGINCQHEMVTKMSMLWIWWIITLVALLFTICAIARFLKRTIFNHAVNSQRFVDIIVTDEH